jgi:hypothetical protein
MTPRCMFVIQIAAFLRAQPYVYVTDAACPMFQRFELLFANKTVPRDSNSLETIWNFGSPGILAGDFAGNPVGWM